MRINRINRRNRNKFTAVFLKERRPRRKPHINGPAQSNPLCPVAQVKLSANAGLENIRSNDAGGPAIGTTHAQRTPRENSESAPGGEDPGCALQLNSPVLGELRPQTHRSATLDERKRDLDRRKLSKTANDAGKALVRPLLTALQTRNYRLRRSERRMGARKNAQSRELRDLCQSGIDRHVSMLSNRPVTFRRLR